VLCAFACVCMALSSPQVTPAQERTPTPSGQELWKTYPLHPTPSPARGPAHARTSGGGSQASGRAGARSGGDERDGLIGIRMAAAIVAGLGVLVLIWIARRPRRVRSDRVPARDELDPGTSPTAPTAGMAPGPDVDAPGAHIAAPPDPYRAWTAEIQWCPTGDDPRFRVVAQSPPEHARRVVAESRRLEWPPADVRSVEAVAAAVDRLGELVIAAGWRPLERGEAWYAKRFAWTPVEAPPHQSRLSPGPPSRTAPGPPKSPQVRSPSRGRS
jgi:hypothetical protein